MFTVFSGFEAKKQGFELGTGKKNSKHTPFCTFFQLVEDPVGGRSAGGEGRGEGEEGERGGERGRERGERGGRGERGERRERREGREGRGERGESGEGKGMEGRGGGFRGLQR